MLRRLAHVVLHHRKIVLGAWILLTIFGAFAAPRAVNRLLTTFSIPGSSAYQANQQIVKTFGNGDQRPFVLVFHDPSRDVTAVPGVQGAINRAAPSIAARAWPRTSARIPRSTCPRTATRPSPRSTRRAEAGFGSSETLSATQQALDPVGPARRPGLGHRPGPRSRQAAGSGGGGGPSIIVEVLIGGLGALIILLFVFGTLPAVAMPLLVAAASILNTFSVIWLLTYITDVSIIVEFLVALVGLGIAIDYSLLFIFRFREELAQGETVEEAVTESMVHAGHSIVVSGSTVGIGLLSMVIIPIPFIRSIGIGGLLIPTVSVIAALTLLPAMLSLLGHRINHVRVLPERWIGQSDPDHGFWGRWAQFVTRHAGLAAGTGLVIVALLLIPASQLNPGDALAKDKPGSGPAITGRDTLAAAGITAGAIDPFAVTARGVPASQIPTVVSAMSGAQGMAGAAAPPGWTQGRPDRDRGLPGHGSRDQRSPTAPSATCTTTCSPRFRTASGAARSCAWPGTHRRAATSAAPSTGTSPTSCSSSWS